jgi:hypothetical protein
MTNCIEESLSEVDAKNKAVKLTRNMRSRKPRTGKSLGQARAYFCKNCEAWHVRIIPPTETFTRKPICHELSSTLA